VNKNTLDLFARTASRQPSLADLAAAAGVHERPTGRTRVRLAGAPTTTELLAGLGDDPVVTLVLEQGGVESLTSTPDGDFKEAVLVRELFRLVTTRGDRCTDVDQLEASPLWVRLTADPDAGPLLLAEAAAQRVRLDSREGKRVRTRAACRSWLLKNDAPFVKGALDAQALRGPSGAQALAVAITGGVEVRTGSDRFKTNTVLDLSDTAAYEWTEEFALSLGAPSTPQPGHCALVLSLHHALRSDQFGLKEPSDVEPFLAALALDTFLAAYDAFTWVEAGTSREDRRKRALSVDTSCIVDKAFASDITDVRVMRGAPEPSEKYYRVLWLFANQGDVPLEHQLEVFAAASQTERIIAVRQGGKAQAYFASLLMECGKRNLI
jgi:hypothetical protein